MIQGIYFTTVDTERIFYLGPGVMALVRFAIV